jgi:hypothetical protein
MHGYALAQTILSGPDGLLPLVILCGLLHPLQHRVRPVAGSRRSAGGGQEAARGYGPDRPGTTIGLNSIELALIAELNLEQARAHDAVANDPDTRTETRLAAARAAGQWRVRASLLQRQAQRQSSQPMLSGYETMRDGLSVVYTGPERREWTRRTRTRRATAMPPGPERREPDAPGDRRRGDRRCPQLAL